MLYSKQVPLVNEGEALFYIARFKHPDTVANKVEEFQYEMDPETDEIPTREPPVL